MTNYSKERRSGVERRIFSYSLYIPERRLGTDQRECFRTVRKKDMTELTTCNPVEFLASSSVKLPKLI